MTYCYSGVIYILFIAETKVNKIAIKITFIKRFIFNLLVLLFTASAGASEICWDISALVDDIIYITAIPVSCQHSVRQKSWCFTTLLDKKVSWLIFNKKCFLKYIFKNNCRRRSALGRFWIKMWKKRKSA